MSDEIVHIASIPDSVQVSEIGVTFAGDVSYDDWLRLMGTLTRLEKAVQFAIGDAINKTIYPAIITPIVSAALPGKGRSARTRGWRVRRRWARRSSWNV